MPSDHPSHTVFSFTSVITNVNTFTLVNTDVYTSVYTSTGSDGSITAGTSSATVSSSAIETSTRSSNGNSGSGASGIYIEDTYSLMSKLLKLLQAAQTVHLLPHLLLHSPLRPMPPTSSRVRASSVFSALLSHFRNIHTVLR